MKQVLPNVIFIILILYVAIPISLLAQEVEVQGKLKVSDMTSDDTVDELVIRKTDGTLGTRDVASLPTPPPPIEDERNLASDYELAKFLCECPYPPPFFIKSLLESGYSEAELFEAGVPYDDIKNAQFTCGEPFTDIRDNQSYATVFIAGQCWMAENLNIGSRIDGANDQTDNGILEKYCYDDDPGNCAIYGGLYQGDEMMQYTTLESAQGIRPAGWHVPADYELKALEMALGMSLTDADGYGFRGTNQGSKMAGNAVLWLDGDLENDWEFGTSGFNLLPGGKRETDGLFYNYFGGQSYLWSSTYAGSSETFLYSRTLQSNQTQSGRFEYNKILGTSVRCVKD